jgi:uncharacterized protein YcgL (UPF0745 family)
MFADIYSTNRRTTFLLVPRGATTGDVPEEVLAALGHLTFLNTRNVDDPSLGVDTSGINSDLSTQGYSVRKHPSSASCPEVAPSSSSPTDWEGSSDVVFANES